MTCQAAACATVAAVALSALAVPAAAQCPALEAMCLASYNLDESDGLIAHDSVAGLDADLMNGPIWNPTGGTLCGGGSLILDGYDDYVQLPGGTWDDFYEGESFCVSFCAKPAHLSDATEHIVGRYHPGNNDGINLGYNIHFEYQGPFPGHYWMSARTNSTGAALYVVSWDSYPPGEWHHVCGVRDQVAGELRLYVDGVLAADPVIDTMSGDFTQNSFVLARCGDSDQSYFAGEVDQVEFWSGIGPCPTESSSWSVVKALYR